MLTWPCIMQIFNCLLHNGRNFNFKILPIHHPLLGTTKNFSTNFLQLTRHGESFLIEG
uniref:Uncharacterized protein n=1 Tax=Pseudomonas putida TaxID=303 RepID=Q2M5M9_PSEPU|nr:unknown [Pseudomonas putida]